MICIDEKQELSTVNTSLEMADGAKAVKTNTVNGEIMQVFSKDGGIVFEYDTQTGRYRLHVPHGDLEVSTGTGDILFNAAKNIRFAAPESVIFDSNGIGMNAQNGNFRIEKTAFTGTEFTGSIRKAKLMMERMESIAETVIDKAKNIYQTVEELMQTRTGRMRTLINTSWHCKSKKAFLKSEDDFKIKGEKIYLG